MKRLFIWLIRFYQKYISPQMAPCCRFSPTCSCYGVEAIERFGAIKGTALTLWRILRCNPWSAGGYDPVPEKKNTENYKRIDYKEIKKNRKEMD